MGGLCFSGRKIDPPNHFRGCFIFCLRMPHVDLVLGQESWRLAVLGGGVKVPFKVSLASSGLFLLVLTRTSILDPVGEGRPKGWRLVVWKVEGARKV